MAVRTQISQVEQAHASASTRWPSLLACGLATLVVLLLVQPAVQPPALALILPAALIALCALLPRLRRPRTWGHLVPAVAGIATAVTAYLLLWLIAAPTGFPSDTFGSPDAPITEVYVRPDKVRLEVGVGTCNQSPQVTAVETAEEVWLSSNEKVPRGGADLCQDGDVVALDEPLSDRTVLDEATGKVLDVQATD